MPMLITAVRSRAASLPLAPVPYSTERGGTKREWGMTRLTPHRPEPSLEYVIVEIDSDSGITGGGEACADIGFFGEPARSLRDMEDDENRCAGIVRWPALSDQPPEEVRSAIDL